MIRKQLWVWTPLAPFISLVSAVVATFFLVASGQQTRIIDFAIFYKAAAAVSSGGSPFDVTGYFYSPFFAWALQPLSWLSMPAANRVWYLVQIAALAGLTTSAILASGSRLARQYWGVVWLAVVLLVPSRLDIVLGQTGSLLAFLLVGCFAARRRPWLAGTLLTLAALIKVYPAVLWLFFLLWRPRAARQMALVAVVLGILSIVLCGPAIHIEWIGALMGGEPYPTKAQHNDSLVGFWLRLLTANPFVKPLADVPWLAYSLLGLSSLAVIGACAWLYRNRHDKSS